MTEHETRNVTFGGGDSKVMDGSIEVNMVDGRSWRIPNGDAVTFQNRVTFATGVPIARQAFMWCHGVDARTIVSGDIPKSGKSGGGRLFLFDGMPGSMSLPDVRIVIKSTMGTDQMIVDARPNTTIYGLKAKIHDKHRVPIRRIRLMWNGITLHDSFSLRDYGIEKHATLQIIPRCGI